MKRILLATATLALLTGACSDESTSTPDGAAPDIGLADGPSADRGAPDEGLPDQGSPDQGSPDQSPPDQGAPDGPGGAWQTPACTSISGFAGLGFGAKEGTVVTPSKVPFPPGKSFTTGLVALQRPNTLVAIHDKDIYRSVDAGCSWTKLVSVAEKGMTLTAGVGDRAWAWRASTSLLYRIDGLQVTTISAPQQNIMGLGVHPTKAGTLRLGARYGAIHQSTDAGKTWTKLSGGAPTGSVTYHVAFDPKDLDHALVGSSHKGFFVTTDAGKTWKASTGLTAADKANGFSSVISPADGKVVWASAMDLADSSGVSNGRRVFRSTDGGKTFTKAVTHQQHKDVIMTNGLPLYPHPTRKELVYFTFGTCASMYGTNLYRYDATAKKLTWGNHPYPGYGALAFSPADPAFLYLAIHGNDDPLCP